MLRIKKDPCAIIIKDSLSFFEPDTMLRAITLVFLFVPLELKYTIFYIDFI